MLEGLSSALLLTGEKTPGRGLIACYMISDMVYFHVLLSKDLRFGLLMSGLETLRKNRDGNITCTGPSIYPTTNAWGE
jgi:hypothetical protein